MKRKNRVPTTTRRPRVFTWHIHGNYLFYLTQAKAEFYLPFDDTRSPGYTGKTKNFPFGSNVHEVHKNDVKGLDVDLILFQDDEQFLEDQYTIFSKAQQKLPKVYLEHDPPLDHPVNTKHIVDDPDILLVHVTYFNQLMWDNNRTATTVVEHGVLMPDKITYNGKLEKGIVMVNNIQSKKRGQRRMGYDIFSYIKKYIPLDIIGMESKGIGGLGEIPYGKVANILCGYRFFFNPIRYTSLGLSVCEAMSLGLPIVGIATTEMPNVIENNVSGFVDTNIDTLIAKMKLLLEHPKEAKRLGDGAKEVAKKRFSIERFAKDWEDIFSTMTQKE